MSEPVALGPDGGERVRRHRILCELPEVEIVELVFGPDFGGVPEHVHDDHVDAFYVLEGEAEFTLDGTAHRVGPGSCVAAPPGVRHGFRNAGPGDLRLLNVHGPNRGFGSWLRGSSPA